MEDRKFNLGKHISLDDIPLEECEMALLEFADGSLGLEKCLRLMWINGLRTYCCSHGEEHNYDIGHIVMDDNEDVFSYLSEEILNDNRIRIDIVDGRQEIKFAGTPQEKEGAMLFLARELQRGKKKHNYDLVRERIGEPFIGQWIRVLRTYDYNPESAHWAGTVYIKKK